MSNINDLIAQHCPNGVEFKALGEVCILANSSRKPVKSGLRKSGIYPYYGANNIQDFVDGFTHVGEYVLVAEDGTKSIEDYSIQFVSGKFWANNHIHVIKGNDKLNSRFLFHFLKSMNFRPFLSGGERAKLTKANMIKIPIPIPPLAVQEKIVDILDSFSKLEAELEAELAKRKQQYEYYRNQLLSFDDSVDIKTLGEVGDFTYGYVAKAQEQGEARFVRITDIGTNGKLLRNDPKFVNITQQNRKFILNKNDLLMARTGATYGKTMIFDENYPAIFAGFLIKLSFMRDYISPKYYWHFAQSNLYWKQANSFATGGGQPQFNANVLKKIKIPVPPLATQEKIVEILDGFDALVNDLSSGLPAEIKARRQQYEYYRNQLLSFKELAK